MTELEKYVCIFFFYSIGGWIMESTRGFIKTKKFVNRGYLIGPCLPVYGFGLVLLTLCLETYTNDIIVLCGMSIVLCGILEYFTSWLMEKLFKARWWDYHNRKFNINGRVCLETLLPFGVVGSILLKWINPFILKKMKLIPINVLKYILLALIVLFGIDFVISTLVISNLRKTATKLEEEEIAKDSTEEITEKVKEITTTKAKELRDDAIDRAKGIRAIAAERTLFVKNSTLKRVQNIKDQADMTVKSLKLNVMQLSNDAKKTFYTRLTGSTNKIKEEIINRITTTTEFTNIVKEQFSKTWFNRRFLKAFPNLQIKSKILQLKDDNKYQK